MSLTLNLLTNYTGWAPEEKTVSGTLLQILDALARPAKALALAIEPAQDLHGYDSPWPAGGGKNLLQLSGRTAITSGSHGTARDFSAPFAYIGITRNNYFLNNRINSYSITDDSVTVNISQSGYGVGLNVSVSAETAYTISYKNKTTEYIGLGFFDANGEYLSNKQFYGTGTWSFTTPANCVNLMVVFSPASNTNVDVTYNDVQLELGASETSYAPYSNICPISGFTGANIYRSGADTSNPTVFSVDWTSEAGTVYGGTINVLTGELTVKMAVVDIGDLSWDYSATAKRFSVALPGVVSSASWNNFALLCSVYKKGNVGNNTGPDMAIGVYSGIAYLRDTRYATRSDLQTAMGGQKIVYQLATPQTYQLTPQEVTLLLGENNLWASTDGELTLTYYAAPE